MASMAEGYAPGKTKINDDKLAEWLRSAITGNLEEVPGVGPANAKLLAAGDEPVTNTYQLVGKFLSLKGDKMSVIEHCDRFYYWLQHKGVDAGRDNIVRALGDKCEVFMPGIYDESVYAAEGAAAEER